MNAPTPANADRYSGLAIALHWLVAALIVCGFTLGLVMVDLKISPAKLRYFSWHKWLGITVFLLAAIRLAWRLVHPPPPPVAMPPWQHRSAAAAHAALYVLMFAVPITGWLYSSAAGVKVVYLGLVPLPDLVAVDKVTAETLKSRHHLLNWMLLGIVVVHAAAALKHHLIDRDGVLARMLPPAGPRRVDESR